MNEYGFFLWNQLVSRLWVCGESVTLPNPPLSFRTKRDPGTLPIFQDVLLLSNHTPGCTFPLRGYIYFFLFISNRETVVVRL